MLILFLVVIGFQQILVLKMQNFQNLSQGKILKDLGEESFSGCHDFFTTPQESPFYDEETDNPDPFGIVGASQ